MLFYKLEVKITLTCEAYDDTYTRWVCAKRFMCYTFFFFNFYEVNIHSHANFCFIGWARWKFCSLTTCCRCRLVFLGGVCGWLRKSLVCEEETNLPVKHGRKYPFCKCNELWEQLRALKWQSTRNATRHTAMKVKQPDKTHDFKNRYHYLVLSFFITSLWLLYFVSQPLLKCQNFAPDQG